MNTTFLCAEIINKHCFSQLIDPQKASKTFKGSRQGTHLMHGLKSVQFPVITLSLKYLSQSYNLLLLQF